ncbi:MAG: hypothetical protein ACREJB_03040, partial [Planctomycetaceae bacterium]
MRTGRYSVVASMFVAVLVFSGPSADAGDIDAVRGRRYKLTKRHGPWMIMVASFSEPPEEVRTEEGLSPEEAADELVYELRRKGIPAYTFSQEDVYDELETHDSLGRQRRRQFLAQQGSIVVLAGNYPDPEDPAAKWALDKIKSFRPKFLTQMDPESAKAVKASGDASILVRLKSGGIFRRTSGRPTPLSRAFMTINPLLSPEEVQRHQRDPLLLKLNTGNEYSLMDNPGRYTLIIGSFYGKGKSITALSGTLETAAADFELENDLDQAAVRAWEMAKALRQGNFITRVNGKPQRQAVEAYVWHERYRSVVTIGAFDDLGDPRVQQEIRQLQQ